MSPWRMRGTSAEGKILRRSVVVSGNSSASVIVKKSGINKSAKITRHLRNLMLPSS